MEILSEITENLVSKLSPNRYSNCDFDYTAAIGYPFVTQSFMQTRFSDGTFPVCYGSDPMETTIYETAYHVQKNIHAIERVLHTDEVIRMKRSVYEVSCNAILIHVLGREQEFPELISNHYNFCHQLGKYVSDVGYPGVVSPSVRHPGGQNFNIFQEKTLENAYLFKHMTYDYYPISRELVAKSNGFSIKIKYADNTDN